jgi:hypothetical protein
MKETYQLSEGRRLEFVHDHSEKTFDAWEVGEKGQKRLIVTQPTIVEPYEAFRQRILVKMGAGNGTEVAR